MTPASELLGVRDTEALRVQLFPLLPEQVTVRPLPRWAIVVSSWVAAITTPWAIYVRRDVLTGDADRLGRLLVHELVHARQWRTHGPLGFLRRYLGDYLRGRLSRLGHREAYLRIGLEVEAYETAARS